MSIIYIFTYLTVVVFIIAIIARAVRIASTPVHLRWELYPVAHEGKRAAYGGSYLEDLEWWTKKREVNKLGELKVMLPEIFLLKGLWEHNRGMWFPSFCLHHGIYWSAGLAALLVLKSVFGFDNLLMLSKPVGLIGYLVGTVGAIWLMVKRLTDSRLRPYSSFSTYFNLLFLLAVFGTGLVAGFQVELHFRGMAAFFAGLFGKGFVSLPAATALHIFLATAFALYLPFTHMTHFFIKYFTYHSVRWNDEPNVKGGKLEKEIEKVLKYPVAWSAKHIGADGRKNWAEIATSEAPENEK